MKRRYAWALIGLMIGSMALSGCSGGVVSAAPAEVAPATIEHLSGLNPTRETLSAQAAKRLGIRTAGVSETTYNGTTEQVIPYGAIIYDTQGATWVYTSDGPLSFIRVPVTIDEIQGSQVFIKEGPAAGSTVVTTGAEELYGAEFEFAEE
jgi:hypothetical protein